MSIVGKTNLLFYRYRPLCVAKIKSVIEELENQEIHLASREQLNDPMEAIPLFIWEAGQVDWKVLLDHYLLSLASAWNAACKTDDEKLVLSNFIIIDQQGHKHHKSFYSFVKKVRKSEIYKLPSIMETAGALSTEVLISLLSHCQFRIISLLLDWHKEFLGSHNINIPKELSNIDFEAINRLLIYPDKSGLVELAQKKYSSNLRVSSYGHCADAPVKTRNFLWILNEFPRVYFEQIGRKRSDAQFLVSSFFGSQGLPDNFLMWSHYADGHKGICLIFDAPIGDGGDPCLRLEGSELIALKEVNYSNIVPEINAFDAVGSDQLETRARFKLRIWKDEKEYRIIESNTVDPHILKYDFNALQGIVFGVNTPEKIKMEAYKIVWNKCRKLGREQFMIYQSHLSSVDGSLSILKVMGCVPELNVNAENS